MQPAHAEPPGRAPPQAADRRRIPRESFGTAGHRSSAGSQLDQRARPCQVHPVRRPGGKRPGPQARRREHAARRGYWPKRPRTACRQRDTSSGSLGLSRVARRTGASPGNPSGHQLLAGRPWTTSHHGRQRWRHAAPWPRSPGTDS
eukprot:scaffold27535_cov103-Phaeocystis_antarctica.AAC.5